MVDSSHCYATDSLGLCSLNTAQQRRERVLTLLATSFHQHNSKSVSTQSKWELRKKTDLESKVGEI